MYLHVYHASGYIEVKNGNKYLIFDSTDENKDLLKEYKDVRNGIENKTKTINIGKCEKDYMKISFNSDDDLFLTNH